MKMEEEMPKWLARCEVGSTYAAVFSVLMMMTLTTADAVGRYFFNSPVGGAYDLMEDYLMFAATFLGAGVSYRRGGFIRVTILMERVRRKVRIPINFFVQIVTILYGGVLVIATILQLSRTVAQGTVLGTLPLPKWPGPALILLGLLLMSLLLAFDLPNVAKGKSSLFREKSPTAQ